MNERKRILIVGGTSAIAVHCARLWLQTGPADLILLVRDSDGAARTIADLQARSPGASVQARAVDFTTPSAIRTAVDEVTAAGRLDIALIAHGFLPEQARCQTELDYCSEALLVNGTSPVLFAEALATHMERANHGTLALIGSVAGDRGRKSNYTYGAAKGLVTRYVQGLQHRFAGSGVKVVLIKPGPTDTPMTAHLKAEGGRLATVDEVAVQIVKGIEQGRAVVYAPAKWRLIMTIIQHLPPVIFNRLNI